MAAFISISADVRAVAAGLSDLAQKQIPFAVARAVTALAFKVQAAERAAISSIFQHPRPFTQKAMLVTKATKSSPTATVFVKPEVAEYLGPYEFGGTHRVPGRGIATLVPVGLRLDQYGQIRGKPSAIGNRTNVFVGTVNTKNGPVWGFWQRLKAKRGGPALKLLLRAEQSKAVTKKLGFADRARATVQSQAEAIFEAELAKAIAGAK